jgi:hypothetical protein
MNLLSSPFMKRVAVMSTGFMLISMVWSHGVFGQTPEEIQIETTDSKNTTLSGTCNGVLRIEKSHEIDFGSFTTSEVTWGTKTNPWVKTGEESVTSLSNSQGGVLKDIFISVKDDCGVSNKEEMWTLSMQLSDMTNDNGHKVFGDNIGYTSSGGYFILTGLNLENPEINTVAYNVNPSWPTVYQPTYTNSAEGIASPVTLLYRQQVLVENSEPNFYPGEYGVSLSFANRIPQYQPAGTYTWTITLSFIE